MKKEEDKIIDGFRNRMKDYSEPMPEGLWESLEKELSPVAASNAHPFRRFIVAAAAVLVLISSVTVWYMLAPIETYVTDIPVESPKAQTESTFIAKTEEPKKTQVKGSQEIRTIADNRVLKEENTDRQHIVEIQPAEVEETSEEGNEQQSVVNKQPDHKQNRVEPRSYAKSDRKIQPITKKNREMKKWSVSVSVANATMEATSANTGFNTFAKSRASRLLYSMESSTVFPGVTSMDDDPTPASAHRNILYNSIRKDVKTDVKHRMPISFGASFRYPLSRNVALETGLLYTILSSELRSGSEADYWIQQQKLHYLGIPLKVNWTFLNTKYLTLYLSGGGALEKSVSGKLSTDYFVAGKKKSEEDESLTIDPVQWSVGASVGIQYNATKHLGIYVEPGVVHYLNDGSDVETIRKEKPTNFNLQMGIRFTY